MSSVINKKILESLGVEKGETQSVVLLFVLSLFLGFFHITLELSATTLFLSHFNESMLSQALLISGLLGLSITFLYSKLQSVISFSKLVLGTLVFIVALTISLRFGFYYIEKSHVIFALFILMGPLTILSIIAYWGVAGRMFSLRQGKRLFGLVYSGQLFGVIILSFATKLLLVLVNEIENLLFISTVAVSVAFFIQIVISTRFSDKLFAADKTEGEEPKEKARLSVIYKNKYVSVMALFIVLSVITAFFIYYSFLAVSKMKYPDPAEMAGFFGLFIASANIFSFIVRTFVHSKILNNYGLKVTLVLIPVLLGMFTLLAVVIGSIWGFDINSPQFIFFFIIMALSRLFYLTLKESIQLPTFEIIYQSLHKRIRFMVQAAIDGVVNEFAAIFSGLLLVAFGLISGFKLIHYSYLLTAIIAVWVFVAIRLYKEYKNSLQASLEETRAGKDDTVPTNISALISTKLSNEDARQVIGALKMAELIMPLEYERNLLSQLNHSNASVRLYVVSVVERELMLDVLPQLKKQHTKEKDKVVHAKLNTIINSFEENISKGFTHDEVAGMVSSVRSSDRRIAAKISCVRKNDDGLQFLIVLLRDVVGRVRRDALKTAERIRRPELISMLIDNFLIPEYSVLAGNAIVSVGKAALPALEQTFHKSGIDHVCRVRIVNLMSQIGGDEAVDLLLDKINFPNRQVVIAIVKALLHNNYNCSEKNKETLKQIISENAGVVAWNLCVYESVLKFHLDKNLTEAIKQDIADGMDVIYLLMSMLYDKKSISHIRENIESEESERVNYAIELMDLFVAEELKPYLFLLFEDISLHEKVKKLHDHFPITDYTAISVLEDIINRDANCINQWTKACALLAYNKIENVKISDSIVAQLFSSDRLLREIAARLISSVDSEKYSECIKRVSPDVRYELESMLSIEKRQSFFDNLKSLESIVGFSSIDKSVLTDISTRLESIRKTKGEEIFSSSDSEFAPLYIIKEGKIALESIETDPKYIGKGQIVDSLLINESKEFKLIAQEDTELYVLNRSDRDRLLTENEFMAESLMLVM